jgi:hypothetical protein
MGHQDDKIEELERELARARHLLRCIGDTMGIEFEPPTTNSEVIQEHHRFLEAFAPMFKAYRTQNPTPAKSNPRPAAPGSWDTHDEEVDAQIDRLEAQGLTQAREPGAGTVSVGNSPELRLTHSPTGHQHGVTSDIILNEQIQAIAHELGLNMDEMPLSEALSAILEEIVRVKNQGADVEAESGSKFLSAGKSLGQAIAHDHAQAAELRDGVAQARTIVARLAAVMQIGTWDKDGTELLERAQRWEGWKYHLMQRVKALRSAPEHKANALERGTYEAVAVELQRQLDRLLSPKELQNWLKALEKAGAAVKVDAGPPVPPYPFEFRPSDGGVIGRAIDESLSLDPDPPAPALRERLIEMSKVFDGIGNSQVSAEEFARTMNLVILPILARQRAAQKVPGDEG